MLRRSPAPVTHQDRHHAVVLTELFPDALLDRSPGIVIELDGRHALGGAGVTVLGSVGSRGERTTPSSTYDYFLYVVSTLPLQSTRVCGQHSPLSLLCITMILCVRRKFFEITTFPNRRSQRFSRAHEEPG